MESNVAPSPSELSRLQRLILEEERNRAWLVERIERLKAKLESLHKQADDSLLRMRSYRIATYPARRLPPEIIGEIFLHIIVSLQADKTLVNSVPSYLYPFQVCSAWREVAVNMPQVWTSLSLSLDVGRLHGLDEIISTFWGRARTFPLSLHLQCDSFGGKCPSLKLQPFVERIETLCLDVPPSFVEGIFSPYKSELLGLHRLIMHWSSQTFTPITSFVDATQLTSFTLYGPSYGCAIGSFNLPWSQLRTLDLRKGPVGRHVILPILSTCGELEDLRINLVRSASNTSSAAAPVTIPSLRRLSITGAVSVIPDFLNDLILPSLVELEVINITHTTWYKPLVLSTLQQRSKFSLSKFRFDGATTPDDMTALLDNSPFLVELSLKFSTAEVTDTVLSLIASKASVYLPALHTLSLSDSQQINAKGDLIEMIHEIIAQRWNGSTRIERLRQLQFLPGHTIRAMQEQLRDYISEGLHLST
ncbi:hypothetical protein BDQ12DRAFT_472978 [Crucibulum laeve]|uniref:Uncharacterized protein n=1 Tax=Crucibulum laeve TaxID=68775 RepID=A0A5C3LID1_9AGAR|nr:hypothetical protein BDQ12DRAFT_472978 [Crucibulum laeve]